jgi:2-methylisocitrate lyase-like PEP mutase family enzyme
VAAANGFEDGERVPLDLVIANLRRIVGATGLPVTIDLEGGYGADPAAVGRTVAQAVEAGAIGCNLEDSDPRDGTLRDPAPQAARVAAARAAATRAGVPVFVNARTDVFLRTPRERHDESMVAAALDRARLYAAAGADGLFVPGLADEGLLARVTAGSPLPVNVIAGASMPPIARLAELGVARVSHGPGPYRVMRAALERSAREAMAWTA